MCVCKLACKKKTTTVILVQLHMSCFFIFWVIVLLSCVFTESACAWTKCSALLNQTSTSRTAKGSRVMTALIVGIQGYFTALRASVVLTPASRCPWKNAVKPLKRTSDLLSRLRKRPQNHLRSWATGECRRHQALVGVKLLDEIPFCDRGV